MPSIFIVDDDLPILDALDIFFKKRQYLVHTFPNGRDILTNIEQHKPNLVLMDVNLSGEDGRDLCQIIKEKVDYPIKIILFSANPMTLLTYEHNYADGIINKPFSLKELENECRKVLSQLK